MATIYCCLATYFSFPSAILGDKASGWLGCAAHGMCDITCEPMRPSEELENESEMTLELFGPLVKQSAVTSHSPTARLDHDAGRCLKQQKSYRATLEKEALQQ